MNGPHSAGPEYTGKHRRDSGPGGLPAWAGQAGGYGTSMPVSDGRPVPEGGPVEGSWPEPALRPETGRWFDAG